MKLVLVILLATASCDPGGGSAPGQGNYLATFTVINRTTLPLHVWSGTRTFDVPACSERTEVNFPINWWNIDSPGTNAFHSGGGHGSPHSFVVVTTTPSQVDERPATLPPCEGQISPA